MERAYRGSTRVLGALTFALGIALIVITIAKGGGPLATGFVVGVLFALLGASRVYLATRSGTRSGRA